MNEMLIADFGGEEVKTVLKEIGPTKAPVMLNEDVSDPFTPNRGICQVAKTLICLRCNTEVETNVHAMIGYHATKNIWVSLGFTDTIDGVTDNLWDWFTKKLNGKQPVTCHLILITVWAIWFNSNKQAGEARPPSVLTQVQTPTVAELIATPPTDQLECDTSVHDVLHAYAIGTSNDDDVDDEDLCSTKLGHLPNHLFLDRRMHDDSREYKDCNRLKAMRRSYRDHNPNGHNPVWRLNQE
ncbi:hypothetical protein J1N35_004797 [Gossypium stocksii]|uniref:Uncharacterized protein n=1 Tax=Gossypium stocksii TaxID=47602 RepID=A0A9D4AGF7_9ROSI|nr:hypothetical protein J1N35_004797 [Gossypium stocksii]